MKDISEVRKAMDTTQEMFEPLHQMIVMLKQHGVDVSGVQVAEKDVQVCAACGRVKRSPLRGILNALLLPYEAYIDGRQKA